MAELGEPSAELEGLLRRYLELRIRGLERDEHDRLEARRRERARAAVVRVVTAITALVAYAGVLGALTRSTLVAALFNPDRLARNLTAAGTFAGDLIRLIPDALRGVVFSTLGALVLLVLRSASLNLRSEVGGALCAGAITLSLAGLSSAAATSPAGAAAALPGLLAAGLLMHRLLDLLRGLQGRRRHRRVVVAPLLRDAAWGRELVGVARRVRAAIDPMGRKGRSIAFLGLPIVALAAIAAAVAARGGPLFGVGLSGFAGLGAWLTWACVLSPPWARIPLWSMVPWALFCFSLLVTGPVAVIFSLSVMATLAVNAVALTLPRREPAQPVLQQT